MLSQGRERACHRPIEVAICSDVLPGLTIGGRESRLLQLGELLPRDSAQVRLVTLWRDRAPVRFLNDLGIKLSFVAKAIDADQQRKRSSLNSLILVISTTWWLLWNRADVVELDQIPHAAFPLALFSCWLTGKKALVHWIEGWTLSEWVSYLGSFLGPMAYAGERFSLKRASSIANSDFTADRLRRIHNAGGKPMWVVPPGYISATTAPRATRRFHLGFVGRLLCHKRIDLFLQLVAEVRRTIPETQAVVVGDGEQMESAVAFAYELGLANAVTFTGKLEAHQDVMDIIADMEMLVVCSEREGFGLAVLEASALGVPVFVRASAGNGAAALVKHGVNGFICEDMEQLAERAVTYLREANVHARLRSGARTWARAYSRSCVAQRLLQAYGARQPDHHSAYEPAPC